MLKCLREREQVAAIPTRVDAGSACCLTVDAILQHLGSDRRQAFWRCEKRNKILLTNLGISAPPHKEGCCL
jgi:hypothetical protein